MILPPSAIILAKSTPKFVTYKEQHTPRKLPTAVLEEDFGSDLITFSVFMFRSIIEHTELKPEI